MPEDRPQAALPPPPDGDEPPGSGGSTPARDLPERIKRLDVLVGQRRAGPLVHESTYTLAYERDDPALAASLLMPTSRLVWQDGDLFPVMDMNLPEGYLFQRILEAHPKQRLGKMHLLALMGTNGIGRLGYELEGYPRGTARPLSKETLLRQGMADGLFEELVRAYLSTGIGISGVQPKIMVPTRSFTPVPDLIVKTGSEAYEHLAINEWMCLSAARFAGVPVSAFDLSDDGRLLVLERFDVTAEGERLGFEDIAALKGLRVQDRLSQRKYQGSYEQVADVVGLLSASRVDALRRLFEQIAVSVMVRNGDAHTKNFGLLYRGRDDVRLSPLFDVVTTAVYPVERPGGVVSEDRTLALKWRSGRRWAARAYPTAPELFDFGRQVCGVSDARAVIERIAGGMQQALEQASSDGRVPAGFLEKMRSQWTRGFAYADR